MAPSVVDLQGISRVYYLGRNEVHALRNVDLSIGSGEMLAIMGSSGSGKSTLMNVIGCLDSPTSGRYFLDGVSVNDLDKNELADLRNQKLGFVFQGFNLLARTSALDNVELPLLYTGVDLTAAERRRRAMEALTAVGLGDRAHHRPNQMSGGQHQRVAIARALINNAAMVLADEPTGNLDTRTSLEVMEIFQRLNRERRITVLVVTHEADIAQCADRTIAFRDGQVVEDAPVVARRDAGRALAALPPPMTRPLARIA